MTNAQLTQLKNDIAANFAGTPNTADGNADITAAYNALAAPDFFVYRTDIPAQEIFDAIVWANMTPSDAPDGTQAWLNRATACQGKQFNLQTLLMGQAAINGAKANIRMGLQDALTSLPSGAGGASRSAGWTAVRDAVLPRKATRGEKLFSAGTGSAASPATMSFEGAVTAHDVERARNMP